MITQAISNNQMTLTSSVVSRLVDGPADQKSFRVVIQNQNTTGTALIELVNSSSALPLAATLISGSTRTWSLQPGEQLDELLGGPVSLVGCALSGSVTVGIKVMR